MHRLNVSTCMHLTIEGEKDEEEEGEKEIEKYRREGGEERGKKER